MSELLASRFTPKAVAACRVCKRPLSIGQLAAGVCTATACRAIEAQRIGRDALARERREAAALRQRLAARAGITHDSLYSGFRVPAQRARTVALSKRRRVAFQHHLDAIIVKALSGPGPDAGLAPPPATRKGVGVNKTNQHGASHGGTKVKKGSE